MLCTMTGCAHPTSGSSTILTGTAITGNQLLVALDETKLVKLLSWLEPGAKPHILMAPPDSRRAGWSQEHALLFTPKSRNLNRLSKRLLVLLLPLSSLSSLSSCSSMLNKSLLMRAE